MGKLVRKNELMEVHLVEVEQKTIDHDKVIGRVNEYLKNNLVDNKRYECTSSLLSKTWVVEIGLIQVGDNLYNNGVIDENFEDDDSWDQFCDEMASILEVDIFGAPYWYYPK